MAKLPQITLVFWLMKIAATTLGETAGDLLSMTLDIGYLASSVILSGVFLVTVVAQVRTRTYQPPLYWLVILATSTAGTTMSDFMDRTLGLGYLTGSLVLITALVSVLVLWRCTVGSLAVTAITTRRVEILYWAAILLSNTLGTALGDFIADDSGLGFAAGAALVGGLIGALALAYRFTTISHVLLFWLAFILTRPFGAMFGDLMTKPQAKGGLDLGTSGSSAVLAAILVGLLIWTMRRARPSQSPT